MNENRRTSDRLNKGVPPQYLDNFTTSKKTLRSPTAKPSQRPALPTQPVPLKPAANQMPDQPNKITQDANEVASLSAAVQELNRKLELALRDAEKERAARHKVEDLLRAREAQSADNDASNQTPEHSGLDLAVQSQSGPSLIATTTASTSSSTTASTSSSRSASTLSSSATGIQNGVVQGDATNTMDSTVPFIRKTHDLPVFSGIPEQWPVFIAAFRQSTEALRYTPLENIFRLQKCLVGEAREEVDMLLVHPNNIEEAIETLEFQYGRPELLAASQIAKVRMMPSFSERQIDQLVPFARKVRNLVAYLQNGECEYELVSPNLLNELLLKMPMSKRLEWSQHAMDMTPRATLVQFSQWLKTVARYVLLTTASETASAQNHPPSTSNSQPSRNNTSSNQRRTFQGRNTILHINEKVDSSAVPPCCGLCSKTHTIIECYVFLNWNVDRRWEKVKQLRLCFACLRSGHESASCPNKQRCVVESCRRQHHPLLHEEDSRQQPAEKRRNPFDRRPSPSPGPVSRPRSPGPASRPPAGVDKAKQSENGSSKHCMIVANNSPTLTKEHSAADMQSSNRPPQSMPHSGKRTRSQPLLFRIVPVKLYSSSKCIETFAMLDEGSELTIIDEELANQLELHGPEKQLNLQWFGNNTKTVPSREVCLDISGVQELHQRFTLTNVKTVPNINLPIQTLELGDLDARFRHLKRLPIAQYANAKAKILIGLDFCHLAAPHKMIKGGQSGPIAVNTDLGWIVYGRQTSELTSSCHRLCHTRSLDEIDAIVKDYFTTENFGVKSPTSDLESIEDARAKAILTSSTVRVGNRFQTGLLWRSDQVKMPNSYPMALRRLISVENKMRRDPQYANMYCHNMDEYVRKGYARKLNAAEANINKERTWYLPHFGVINPKKPSKLRMVFDAAASTHGTSLNSVLLSGPDWNPPLTGILFKFRIGLVGICGDIREMFHQILIQPKDRCAQRFLWRQGDTQRPPDVYEMVAMTFGATCSPATAQFIKNKNADEHADEYPSAIEPIKCRHYVDDYVASFSSPSEAAAVTSSVIEVHSRAGFELRNFVSSCPETLKQIGAPIEQSPVSMQPKHELVTDRILGMCWDTEKDEFFFDPNLNKMDKNVLTKERRPTKREVLSITMSIFDPFGILADFMLHAKLIVQDLWSAGTGWDDQLPDSLHNRWLQWSGELQNIKLCRIPRCYSQHLLTSMSVQLHLFADASESAFATVGFWRVDHAGARNVSFIAGKTKCAPLKLLSVPRLELQAAVLATRLLQTIREYHHEVAITKTFLWTDSKCVVQWIRSDHRRFKPFVAHRIAEILDTTTSSNWRWLPTSFNVADDATRAKGAPTFNNNSRWLRGPEFLQADEDDWPMDTTINSEEDSPPEEIRPKFVALAIRPKIVFEITRFSNYSRLRRMLAWVYRFKYNALARTRLYKKRTGELTVTEIRAAELVVCRVVQQSAFQSEHDALSNGHGLEPGSSIRQLMPYVDADKVLRIYGRTDAADESHLSLAAKRPILLPQKNHLTDLIIRFYHNQQQHQNDASVMCAIRERFWIPHLRSAVRRIRYDCMLCRLRNAKPKPPVMGQLPKDRLTPYVRPFTYTGLDYFGPIQVSIGRRREKRWVALFTCMTVRAVHLEIAENLSTDACLVSILNFCNLRGFPVRIRSDNGTNFIGASKIIRNATSSLDSNRMRCELAEHGIEWIFNSPGHPEAGGCWERLVQSVKRVLVSMLNEDAPRVETLRCFLLEAANLVNSRPLTHVPVSADDEEPITPNHFLVGGSNTMSIPPSCEANFDTRKQWRVAQHMSSCFWSQWIRSYLPELTRRSKWFVEQRPIKMNDLVLICDSNQSRGQWRRGRVVRIFPGPDGRIRNAEVRTSEGVLKRPTSKLAILDLEISN